MQLRDAVVKEYENLADSVSSQRRFIPTPQLVALGIGVGRVVIGTTFLLAPKFSVRILGVDSASAKRMTFLRFGRLGRVSGPGRGE